MSLPEGGGLTATSDPAGTPGPSMVRGLLPRQRMRLGPIATIAVALVVVVSLGLMMALPMDRSVVGIIVLLDTVGLLLLGVPIAISMFVTAILGLLKLGGMKMLAATFEEATYGGAASWELSVIPLFVFMGILMWRSGLTTGMFDAARLWLGKLPGGLAVGTNFAGAGLAAASGSSIGISYALGRVAVPEMLKANYQPALATGVVTMAGTLGQLIPPSVMLVIYAGIAQTPVGPQLIAGIVPGLLIAFAFAALIMIRAAINPKLAPKFDTSGFTWGQRWGSLLRVLPVAAVVFVVIGGMLGGVFTATEAGAFGALIALIMGAFFGDRAIRNPRALGRMVWRSLMDSAAATAGIFLMLISVTILGRLMALTQIAADLSEGVTALGLDRIGFLLVLLVVFLILGLALEPLAMMLLTLPVLMVPLQTMGVDLIWFGVFMVVMAEIAVVSPPVGMLAFIVARIVQDPEVNLGKRITLTDVFKGVTWFVVAALVIVLLLIVFPEIVTWLPSMGRG